MAVLHVRFAVCGFAAANVNIVTFSSRSTSRAGMLHDSDGERDDEHWILEFEATERFESGFRLKLCT